MTVARQRDIAERQPAEQRSLEAPDFEVRGQILVGLADDESAKLVLAPSRLDDGDDDAGGRQNDGDENDDGPKEPSDHGTRASERRHQY